MKKHFTAAALSLGLCALSTQALSQNIAIVNGKAVPKARAEALAQHRVRIQSSVGRQVRAKKTPILTFRPDDAIRSATVGSRLECALKRVIVTRFAIAGSSASSA